HCSPFITRCESERLGFEQNRKGSKTVLQVLSNSEYFCRKTCSLQPVYHSGEVLYNFTRIFKSRLVISTGRLF
ncbi:hypothetical protein, partial [Staphylococcus haemolyticus]|uniref:hypothetical protein n=1 Tax=Staphylococcus haemolyticus TaxID=1283 RepID=UPI0020C171F1